MARDTNNLTIVGRATRDSVTAYTGGGICYTKFSIAVNGWKENDVSFFDCITWGKVAENVGQYITKGKQVSLEGEIGQTKWKDKVTGGTRYGFQIKVDKVQLLGGGSNQQAQSTEQMFKSNDEDFEDDIPF